MLDFLRVFAETPNPRWKGRRKRRGALQLGALSRWEKLGASSRVKVPVGRRGRKASSQGLVTHPY
jgi:hypothetical protein